MGKFVYLVYLFVIGALNLLIWLTPYLASIGHQLAPSLYRAFSYICHQAPQRSLFLFGFQLPVCARDTAFYFMMLLGGLVYPAFFKLENKKIPKLSFFILAATPLGIDGIGQFLGFWESTNLIRIATGALAGFTIPFYFFPTVNCLKR